MLVLLTNLESLVELRFFLVHSDVWGSCPIEFVYGLRYFITLWMIF
jgi:hypothetical protein